MFQILLCQHMFGVSIFGLLLLLLSYAVNFYMSKIELMVSPSKFSVFLIVLPTEVNGTAEHPLAESRDSPWSDP